MNDGPVCSNATFEVLADHLYTRSVEERLADAAAFLDRIAGRAERCGRDHGRIDRYTARHIARDLRSALSMIETENGR